MEKNQRIELLKDVFTLIHPELVGKANEKGKRDHEERKHRVQTWLQDAVQTTSQEENPWSSGEKGRGDVLHLLPQFMRLLRECILTHHWTQVLSMLKCIAHIPYGADWVTWKTTLAALYTEPESNAGLIKDLFKHCFLLKECNARDVALEFVQYLISQDLRDEASKVMQITRKPQPGGKNEYQMGLNEHTLTLLDGYQGLVFYVDWKAALSKQSDDSQSVPSQSFGSQSLPQDVSDNTVKNLANRATVGLDSVVQKSGVWDIFLTKSVEIHEFYGDFDKAKNLLSMYREKNPDNPNAHKFMYEHLCRNEAHHNSKYVKRESLSCLKSLAKVDPANPLILTLWQTLTDGGSGDQAVRYIFDLLDYQIWQERHEGWQCLAKSLATGFSKERSQEERTAFLSVLKGCWWTRRDWWPAYHFTGDVVMNADRPSSDQLIASKATVAAVLSGEDNHFTTEARKVLNTSLRQHLDQVLSELDWDAVREFTEDLTSPDTFPMRTPSSQSGGSSSASVSSVSNNSHTSTPTPSPCDVTRRCDKDVDSFADADTQRPHSPPTIDGPVTTTMENLAGMMQKSPSLSGGDSVSSEKEFCSGNLGGFFFSSSSSASVDVSSSEDFDSSQTGGDDKQQNSAGDKSDVERGKRKRKQTKRESAKMENVETSDIVAADLPVLESVENATNRSPQRHKRKQRAEEEEEEEFDFTPLKRRRTKH